jgi:hypothetical protein
MASDDPTDLAATAAGMAEMLKGKNPVLAPWWGVGAGVDAIVKLAADDGPLGEPARVALQIMATVYNDKIGRR